MQLNPSNIVEPGDVNKNIILPPVPKQDWADKAFAFAHQIPDVGEGGNAEKAMWVTAQGDLYDYLHKKSSEFSVDMPLGLRNNQSPSLRVQSALGMRDYDKTYVATLEVYPEILFRPKGGYHYDNLEIGAPTFQNGESIESVFYQDSDGHWGIKDNWEEKWDHAYKPYAKGLVKGVMDTATGEWEQMEFSDFYRYWWDSKVQRPTLDEDKPYGNRFPWTGLGYTYDYYYSPDSWDEESANAQGVGEFLVLPRPIEDTSVYLNPRGQSFDPWEYSVLDVQTINQFLKDSNDPAPRAQAPDAAWPSTLHARLPAFPLGL